MTSLRLHSLIPLLAAVSIVALTGCATGSAPGGGTASSGATEPAAAPSSAACPDAFVTAFMSLFAPGTAKLVDVPDLPDSVVFEPGLSPSCIIDGTRGDVPTDHEMLIVYIGLTTGEMDKVNAAAVQTGSGWSEFQGSWVYGGSPYAKVWPQTVPAGQGAIYGLGDTDSLVMIQIEEDPSAG